MRKKGKKQTNRRNYLLIDEIKIISKRIALFNSFFFCKSVPLEIDRAGDQVPSSRISRQILPSLSVV